jgi:hypothetical protein
MDPHFRPSINMLSAEDTSTAHQVPRSGTTVKATAYRPWKVHALGLRLCVAPANREPAA